MESLLASHQLPEGSSRLLFNPGLEAESAWIKPEVFQIENMLDFSYDDDDKIMLITGFTAVNYNCQPEKPNITKDGEKRNEQKYNGQSDEALEEDTEYYRYVLMKELEWPINIMQESNCLNYPSFKLPEERRQGGSSPSSVLLGHSQHQLEQYTTTISATTTTTTTKEEEEEKEQEEEGNFFLRPCFHSARKLIVVSKARSKRARPSSSGARAWSYMAPILHRHNTFLSSLSSDLVQFESQSSCTTIEVDREEDGKNEGDEDECYVHDLDSLPPAKRSKKKTKKKIMFSNEVGQHQLSPPPPLPTTTSCNTNTRRCSHCLTQKTPQWRAGPEGPKTLCNACGVRYKSGRLLPEYRPAGSPTFVSWVHSNSHRKILEMRRLRQEEETHPFPSPSLTHHHHHHHHQEEEEEESEGGGSNDILLMSNYIGVMIDST